MAEHRERKPGPGDRPPGRRPRRPEDDRPPVKQAVDLRYWDKKKAFNGYTLFAPKHNTIIYLIDMEGRLCHSWKSRYEPGQSVYLLENGHLLHCCFMKNPGFTAGGEGGKLEEIDWDGNIVWEFVYSTDQYLMHHDVEVLPNGNILALSVEKKSIEECLAAGFDPDILKEMFGHTLNPDYVIEIQHTGKDSGKVVWEWHIWDHLIQDFDKSKKNYGDVAAHPELVDVNGASIEPMSGRRIHPFWNHMNSIYYTPELDQVMLSVRGNDEFWVLDHTTTTQQAKGHSGGQSGQGGDLLYRWGNPKAYKRGTLSDQKLFQQHDCQWIPEGYPGAGNILVYNNGLSRKPVEYSSVEEIMPPLDSQGKYSLAPGQAYGPQQPAWSYKAENPTDFYSSEISGAQRLPNGNTVICNGCHGVFFEVTPAGETVWEYVNPVIRSGPVKQGDPIPLDHRGHQFNGVFKVHRYAPDYPGLKGKDLTPGKNLA